MTPLRPSPDNRLAPVLCLRHRQNPQARPPAPKLPQPWVDLIHVAPPTAIYSDCVSDSELKRAGLEVQQLVSLKETGKEWHLSKHKIAGGNVQDWSGGLLVQLCGGMIHGPCGRQLELLKGAEKHKTGFHVIGATRPGGILGGPSVARAQKALQGQLRARVPHALQGHIRWIFQAERVGWENQTTILEQHR